MTSFTAQMMESVVFGETGDMVILAVVFIVDVIFRLWQEWPDFEARLMS